MRQDFERFQVVFVAPNGIKWFVSKNSPYVQWLRWTIRGIAKEEEYVGTRRSK